MTNYEIKFSIFDGSERNMDELIKEYEILRDQQKREGSVVAKVISYFFDGMISLVQGDMNYWKNSNLEAFRLYDDAAKMFTRFSNSRTVEVALDHLSNRLLNRSKGLAKLTEARTNQNLQVKDKLYKEALDLFNTEVQIANEMEENMSSYAAFSRAAYTHSMMLLNQAKLIEDQNSGNAKKNVLEARSYIRQAAFINPNYMDDVDTVIEEIDRLTHKRLLNKAEELGDQATTQSEKGNYDEAQNYFKQAAKFYRRASALASDASSRRFLLSSATVFDASIKEAMANKQWKREDNPDEASTNFQDATRFVEKAIALIGRFSNEVLIKSFESQRDYYKAMALLTQGISSFDKDEYKEANEHLSESLEFFKKAHEVAKITDNPALIKLSDEGISEVNGYISMCENLM